MPGKLQEWPAWPEYTAETNSEKEPDLTKIKHEIIEQFGEKALRQSWIKTCQNLEKITARLAQEGSKAIPDIQFADFFNLDSSQKARLQDSGCFVVRNVIPKEQADQWYADLKQYIDVNGEKITGMPLRRLYFSPSQQAARSHPNQLKMQRELNSWWHDDTNSSSPEPLTYADACRLSPPGTKFLGLGPHIDAGSLSRWAEPVYRSSYTKIFSGFPEEFDPYDLTLRQHADPNYFLGGPHSQVFRAFQGWTALTAAGPREGSLCLYPHVKFTVAYLLLRPFFSPPSSENADILDPEAWSFDATTPFFPGTWRHLSQSLSLTSHPHLRMRECLVSIPHMNPGDTIWWHSDMCHAVEGEHTGPNDACVVYIAATPSTKKNKEYIQIQLKDFLDGKVPGDFRKGRDMTTRKEERDMDGYLGLKGITSVEGRIAMGLEA